MANTLYKRSNIRMWFQPGGAGANNPKLFGGRDMAMVNNGGISNPQLGGISPINQQDPTRPGFYTVEGYTTSAPDLPKSDLMLREKVGGVPRQWVYNGCPINAYELVGICKSLGDFASGWDYIRVFSGGRITGRDFGDGASFEEDKALEATWNVIWTGGIYPVGPLNFQLAAPASLVAFPVNDITYGPFNICSDCAQPDDGAQKFYAVTNAGAAAKPNLVYSLDGGKTLTVVPVAAAANNENLVACCVVNSQLILVSKTAGGATQGGYYVSDLDPVTGAPSTPTKITTGFLNVASRAPNDCFVLGSRVLFPADGGYIYYTDNVYDGVQVLNAGLATTANLTRLYANQDVILAVGATNTIIKSSNRGQNFSALTGPSAGALTAVAAVNGLKYWIGDSTGLVWYSTDGGQNFVAKNFGLTGGAITDIAFASNEVGWIAHKSATPTASIVATFDGGQSWTKTAPRVSGLQTFASANRIAVPDFADISVKVNNLAVAGTAANNTDGAVVTGTFSVS